MPLFALTLGRRATAAEQARWNGRLVRSEDYLFLIETLRASEEYAAKRRPRLLNYVELLYELCLSRRASHSESSYWMRRLETGLEAYDLVSDIYGSQEAVQIRLKLEPAANLNDGDFVAAIYNLLLLRGPTGYEIEHWIRALAEGRATRLAILRDFFSEASQGVQDATKKWDRPLALLGHGHIQVHHPGGLGRRGQGFQRPGIAR